MTYRVVHPVQSKDRDVAPRLLLSRLVKAVSRLVEAVSRLVEVVSRLVEAVSRLVKAVGRLVEAVSRLVEARRVTILNQHQDPHRGRWPSRDCRGDFHLS